MLRRTASSSRWMRGMVVDDRDGLLKQVDDWDDEDDYDGKHELTGLLILRFAVK